MLTLENITAGYGQSLILHGVSLTVPSGEVVCLMGRNGVGKTTLLKTIMGVIKPRSGRVLLDDADVTDLPPYRRARAGVGYVPQGRGIFPHLTVLENLLVGTETGRGDRDVSGVYELFPVLKDMSQRAAGRLSGGQQQQLAIARALVGKPEVLLLDEPTEGIQPSVIWEIEHTIDLLRERGGLAILLVEQFVEFAAGLSDAFYLMQGGMVVAHGSSDELSEETVREYLAV